MNEDPRRPGLRDSCLTIDDLYYMVAVPAARGDKDRVAELEKHLAHCPDCREELAGVLRLVCPEGEAASEPEPPLSQIEIDQTLTLIRHTAQQEKRQQKRRWWFTRLAPAAAAVVLLAAGTSVFWYYSRPNPFFVRAKASLEKFYSGKSPSGLRLDLPFQPSATARAGPDESREEARILFSQAIAVRNAAEAHLGLAAVLLSGSNFPAARAEFEEALKTKADHYQGLLGRGVAGYEEGRQAEDPIARRTLLAGALSDFDAAMRRRPDSAAARYNRIWVLYETGRHKEALTEIDVYLANDPDSLWAVRLKDLKLQIQLIKPDKVKEEVNRAARSRDAAALATMARLVHEQIPPAIRLALKTSLQLEGAPAGLDAPNPQDLRWAAEIMESAYGATNGDHSWKALLRFYDDLSPPERAIKRSLDARFDKVALDYNQRRLASALQASASLAPEYSRMRDLWQLANIHHLRGNSFHYQADFQRAENEYREMLRFAEMTGAPELRAKALGALFSAYDNQIRPDEAADCIGQLRLLAGKYRLESWTAFAAQASGTHQRRLSQWDQSARSYTAALGFAYRSRDLRLLEMLLENLFLIMDRLDRSHAAKMLCEQAIEMMAEFEKEEGQTRGTEVTTTQLNLLCRQGEYAFRSGDLDRAENLFRDALAVPSGQLHEIECRSRIGLAQVCLAKRRLEEARLLLEKSLASAVARNFLELEWQAGFLQGQVHREMGDLVAAQEALEKSVAALERLRGRIVSLDMRQQFLERRYDPYKEIVSLLYDDLHNYDKALEFTNRAKSMSLREFLNGKASAPAAGTGRIDADLDALSVDYFFTQDALLAIVSDRGRNQYIKLKVSRSQIVQMVQSFLDSVQKNDEAAFHVFSRKLNDALVLPILSRVEPNGGRKLLIFPDGPLHLLPFGGLQDGGGRFLLEKFALSYAPSRGALCYCLSLGRGSASSRDRTVLLLDGAANLRGADLELARLSNLYHNRARLLTARDMPAAGRLAAEAEIIHFSGHASLVNGRPALLLQPSGEALFDVEDVRSWRLSRNRLVMLAGCSTGMGPQTEGEIPWGLIPAFLNAGAPAIIVSLLPVDDQATATLAAHFYNLLAGGSITKTAALQRAQRFLLDSARAQGRLNPASWLPYVLVGDPR